MPVSFKDFRETLYEIHQYKKIAQLISQGYIPFTNKVQVLLGGGESIKAYHVTELNHLKGLADLGKSGKHISTFTKNLSSVFKNIITKPEVLAVLKGSVVVASDYDIFTQPDKKGNRWLETSSSPKYNFLIEALLPKVIQKMLELQNVNTYADVDPFDLAHDTKTFEQIFNILPKSDMLSVIEFYEQRVEVLLSNSIYMKIINELLNLNKGNLGHNEIVLRDFTVQGVYAIQAGKYRFNNESAEIDIKSAGYKYLGFIPADESHKFI